MFHNGGYANCDDASQHRGNMSNINTLSIKRQARPASTFHNDGRGVASRLQDPLRRTPGGKIGAPIWTLVPTPHAFPSDTQGSGFSFWPQDFRG